MRTKNYMIMLLSALVLFTLNAKAEDDDVPGWLQVPEGYKAIMNAHSLKGWQGRVADVSKVKSMKKAELDKAQKEADELMKKHWHVSEEGTLIFDGRGGHIRTVKEYSDFEFMFEWKVKARGSSGIYLRGYPQVQLWDSRLMDIGSGSLFNNKKAGKKPLEKADRRAGLWNQMKIKMVGSYVWVWLNGKLVTKGVELENFWDRGKPINAKGPIEIENDDNNLYFRNMFIREIDSAEAKKTIAELAKSNPKK